MNAITHTTGPWHCSEVDGTGRPVILWDAQGHYLAHIDRAPGRSVDENRANASLIAAAPEMLEACLEALACILKHVPATEFAPREMLSAVIAKATGDKP